MTETLIIPELSEKIELEAKDTLNATTDLEISDQQKYEIEGARLKIVKSKYKEIKSKQDELVNPFKAATKKLTDFFKKPLTFLKEAEGNIKQALLDYDQKLEEEERKEQQRIDDLAEKERKRLEKLAERQESKGNTEKAEETRERAVSVPRGISKAYRTPIKGISKRDNWIFVITDASLIPREYLIPDEKKLSQVAKAHKGALHVPGVVFKNDPIIASGT